MNQKEHKKKALMVYKSKVDEDIIDLRSLIQKIFQLKAVEIGAIAPDHIEYELGIKHRGFLHSQLLLRKIEDFVDKNVNNDDPIYKFIISPFLIGYISHLKEDKKTKMGIPIIS